jgi:SAM-dependent methyltransferase
MNGSNDETLRSYEARVQEYVDGTTHVVSGAVKVWIDESLAGLSPRAKILELGSAFGRDAAYIAAQGFEVERTDAVEGFVDHLNAQGLGARLFNVITDDFVGKYDFIFANAVLLHFNAEEFLIALIKIRRALKSPGRLSFSLKMGQGESWSSEKINSPRFFRYWQSHELDKPLHDAGFSGWTIKEEKTTRTHAEWLFVIAETA